jgi:hypothetical protein
MIEAGMGRVVYVSVGNGWTEIYSLDECRYFIAVWRNRDELVNDEKSKKSKLQFYSSEW